MIIPTPGSQLLMNHVLELQELRHTMPASESSPANKPEGSLKRSTLDRGTPEAFRMLDWTNLDSAPSSMDVARMAGMGVRGGAARLAVLVNTPRMLRAATVFAEQAGLLGAQVRVFIDAKEAQAWLYRDVPLAITELEWPESHLTSELIPLETPTR